MGDNQMNEKDWIIIILIICLGFISFYAYLMPRIQRQCYQEAGEVLLNNFLNQLNTFGYITIPTSRGNIILVVNRTWQP